MYAVVKKGNLIAVGTKLDCEAYKSIRDNSVKIKKVPTEMENLNGVDDIYLRYYNVDNDDYIISDRLITAIERDNIEEYIHNYFIELEDTFVELNSLIQCIDHLDTSLLFNDAINDSYDIIFGDFSEITSYKEGVDNMLDIYRVLDMYGGK